MQGFEALEVLRGLVYAPVAFAIQAEVLEQVCGELRRGVIPEVKDAAVVNAQSRVLLVEFRCEIAEKVLEAANRHGAAPHPVGAESRYETAPLFYRASGTFRAADPGCVKRMIRINPMRSGPQTVLRILNQAVKEALAAQ